MEVCLSRWRTLGLSECVVLGFSSVFRILGPSITAIGRLFLSYRCGLNSAAGVIIACAGLMIMGVVRTPLWAQRYYRFEPGAVGGNPWSATLLGVAFGFGWTPCIGPVLGSILVLSAPSESVGHGTVLLGVSSSIGIASCRALVCPSV